jgi:hypothetical protein
VQAHFERMKMGGAEFTMPHMQLMAGNSAARSN